MIDIKQLSYHRNGICGEGFYVALFTDPEIEGTMVATIFGEADEEGYFVGAPDPRVAALNVEELAKDNIAFGRGNSWRGDRYADDLYAAIAKHEGSEEPGRGDDLGGARLLPDSGDRW